MRSKRANLSSAIIKAKALSFATQMGYTDFTASNGYINGLKKRQNISFITEYGDSNSVDPEVVIKWEKDLEGNLKDYKAEDIYNLDETALFYRLLPNKSFAFGSESRHGNKKFKDRITLLLITNSDESDRNTVMIGKSKTPRAFRGVQSLPMDYYSQKNSWMDSTIFRQIMQKLNRKMKSKNKKILLFMDNCSPHIQDIDYSNIAVRFFPSNTTSVLQVLY